MGRIDSDLAAMSVGGLAIRPTSKANNTNVLSSNASIRSSSSSYTTRSGSYTMSTNFSDNIKWGKNKKKSSK